ncbi:AraC family transcriptional regulator [Paenibacillus ferrarius]|uniref:AraC family transcriptional regulator n=1 Tax=Paenibacillus ferrarius TaxID=1469647 RepID=UPI003D2D475A
MLSKKNWFNRLLISYIPVFVIIVFILSGLFFVFANYITQSQSKKTNVIFMEQAMSNLDRTLKQIDLTVLRELNTNEGLNSFYFAPEGDRYNGLALPATKLEQLVSGSPEIASAYLYRNTDGKVLSNSLIVPLEVFGDAEFLQNIIQNGPPAAWTPIRGYTEYLDEEPKSVVRLVRRAPLLTGDKGFIVINVSVDYISKMIDQMGYSHYSFIRVLDESGHTINSQGAGVESSRALQSGSMKSAYTGWEMQIGLKEGGFTYLFSSLYIGWMLITVVMLIIGIWWIIHASRTHYRPVESILNQVRAGALHKASAGKDEFHFIQNAITELIDQTNEFQQKHRQDMVYRKQVLFMELIQGNKPLAPEAWKEQLDAYRLPVESVNLQMAVIELDKFQQFCERYSQRDQSLLKFALKSVITEMAEKHALVAWGEWIDSDRLGVLLFHQEETDGLSTKSLFEELHSWVQGHLHFTVTTGLSSSVKQSEDILLAYEEAATALKYKTVLGFSRVIHFLEVKPKQDGDVYNRLQSVRGIVIMYKQGNDEWQTAFSSLIQHLRDDHAAQDDIVITMEYMNYQLNQAMKELHAAYKVRWEQETYPALLAILEHHELLDELAERYFGLLSEEYARLKELHENSSNRVLIRQMQKFIEDHLYNPDLSLNMIGEAFDLNDKQVSQVIKQELGEKFVDYLARLRIQYAKRLLEETDEPIQAVSLKVGYVHALSFIRMFKKMMQMTPGDYRKLHRNS